MKSVFEIQSFSCFKIVRKKFVFPTSSYASPASKNFYHLINKTCAFFLSPSHSVLCYQSTILITLISSQMSARKKLYPGRNLHTPTLNLHQSFIIFTISTVVFPSPRWRVFPRSGKLPQHVTWHNCIRNRFSAGWKNSLSLSGADWKRDKVRTLIPARHARVFSMQQWEFWKLNYLPAHRRRYYKQTKISTLGNEITRETDCETRPQDEVHQRCATWFGTLQTTCNQQS